MSWVSLLLVTVPLTLAISEYLAFSNVVNAVLLYIAMQLTLAMLLATFLNKKNPQRKSLEG